MKEKSKRERRFVPLLIALILVLLGFLALLFLSTPAFRTLPGGGMGGTDQGEQEVIGMGEARDPS